MENLVKNILKLSSTQKIAISFLFIILIGAFLLYLPITHISGVKLSLIDAFFIAASATCVTGLTPLPIINTFNLLGQIVLLLLIQIGGIGIVAIIISFLYSMKQKSSIKNNKIIKEQFGFLNGKEKKTNIKEMIKYIIVVETLGAILLALYFVPKYGLFQGLFKSIFISISAFCNAGFDNLTSTSLIPFANNQYLLIVIMTLIILGGLGFVVWFDIIENLKENRRVKFDNLSLHTRVVLTATGILILLPALLIFLSEFFGPMFSDLKIFNKPINALFTSVTLRTAGFTTCDLSLANTSSLLIMIICMFVGGSPGGTAGGLKTTTMVVIIIYILSTLQGDKYINIFKRRISDSVIRQAITVFAINIFVLLIGVFLLTITEDLSFIEILFEATSALATVGLSMNVTSNLTFVGKIIIIFMMYLGRVGILTFALSFIKKENKQNIQYAIGNLMI